MLPATAPSASNYTSSGPAGHEKIPQLVEENRQPMRKNRKSAAEEAGQKGGRLLLHLGPGVRQAIEGDEVYFVEARGTPRCGRGVRECSGTSDRWACSRRRSIGTGSCASTAITW